MSSIALWDGRNLPALGMGCWAAGGAFASGETVFGYADVNADEVRAGLSAALDGGVRIFDTAAVYGAGQSERLVGEVVGNRDDVLVATKFGYAFDPDSRQLTGEEQRPEAVRDAIDASRKRLKRDRIDLLFLHLNACPVDKASLLFDELDAAVARGELGAFGWSTDFPESAKAIAARLNFRAVQHCANLFFDAPSMRQIIAQFELVAFNRSPLAMGMLSGRFNQDSQLAPDDVRSNDFEWMDYFKGGRPVPELLQRLADVRELLTAGGRTPTQGALAWLWARSDRNIPIPGFRNRRQVEENVAALSFGPLPKSVFDEIEARIARPPEGPARER